MSKRRIYLTLPFAVFIFLAFTSSLIFFSSGPLKKKTNFIVNPGIGFSQLSEKLFEKEIISNQMIFNLAGFLFMYHRHIKSGEYLFHPKISQWDALKMIVDGNTYYRKITIPEGLTVFEAVDVVLNSEGVQGELIDHPKEGQIFPETYFYSWGDSAEDIFRRMYSSFQERTQAMWLNRDANLPIENLNEVLTLASIIEKESSYSGEKARIAGVFYNRLKINMKLQSDPTVIYSIFLKTGEKKARLLKNDLKYLSAYNTYLHKGLPPGPICLPGLDSINAALHPVRTDELYFVADGAKRHIFSRTLKEHNKHVHHLRKRESN